jgi:AcrR family transcriptional regulator
MTKITTEKGRVAKPEADASRAKRGIGQRDREETRKRILAAMGRLFARNGSASLGMNAIAREAGVDKVLIYRYFGGLSKLYRAFALEENTFPSLEEVAEGRQTEFANLSPSEIAKVMIVGFGRAVRRRPIVQEILRWDLRERNELTDALASERECQTRQWLSLLRGIEGADLPAIASILAAGQVFLILRSKTAETYNGINLHSEDGWRRIENAVALLSDLFFEHVEAGQKAGRNQGKTPARKGKRKL